MDQKIYKDNSSEVQTVRLKRRTNALVFLVIAAMLNSCASQSLKSQADDTEGRLRYGQFCGAGHPQILTEIPLEDSQARLDALDTLTPVDALDSLCQLHDKCFETYGHDSYACDSALAYGLNQLGTPGYSACDAVAFEWQAAFLVGKKSRDPVERNGIPGSGAVDAVGRAIQLPVTAVGTAVLEVLSFGQQTRRARKAQQVIRSGETVCQKSPRVTQQLTNAFRAELAAKTALTCGWTGTLRGYTPRVDPSTWTTYGLPAGKGYTQTGGRFQEIAGSSDAFTLPAREWVVNSCEGTYTVFEEAPADP